MRGGWVFSNPVAYSSIFMYNPYELTGPYQHFGFDRAASNHVRFTYTISISIVEFGDMHKCAEWIPLDTPMS